MNYQEQYADRLTTPAKAAKMLESGMVCASDIGLAHSCLFFDAVGDRVDRGELSGIVQHSLLDLGPRAYFSPRTAAGYHGFPGEPRERRRRTGHWTLCRPITGTSPVCSGIT